MGWTLRSRAVEAVNHRQKRSIIEKIEKHYGTSDFSGKTFGIWGLAFKPKTDDVREAPALVVCEELLARGARIQAFDPEAIETFKERLGERSGITYVDSNYEAIEGVDALVVCTEWNAFRQPNFERMRDVMRDPVIFDGRNLYAADEILEYGFVYYSVGRPPVMAPSLERAAA
jgi:UDPglucose 6-dehydrogenase